MLLPHAAGSTGPTAPIWRTLAPEPGGGAAGTLQVKRQRPRHQSPAARRADRSEEVPVKAQIGDRLVPDGDDSRAAVVVQVRNADGSPPYVVKWLSDGHIALVFPGPYTRVIRGEPPLDAAAAHL